MSCASEGTTTPARRQWSASESGRPGRETCGVSTDAEGDSTAAVTGNRRQLRALLAAAIIVPVIGLNAAWHDDGHSRVTTDSPPTSASAPATIDDLSGRNWRVLELRVDEQTWLPVDEAHAGYLRIDDDTLTAQVCSGVRAHVALAASSLRVDHLVPEGGYCWDDHDNSGEQLIEVLLRRVTGWSIDGDDLTLEGTGVRARFEGEPVEELPTTTLVSVPRGSLDARAREVCEARHYEDDYRAMVQPRVVAAFDSTVDDIVNWYQATSGFPDEDTGPRTPTGSYPPSPNDVRREYAADTDRYAAVCWIQGYYADMGPCCGEHQHALSVVMVRPDGREWILFGSTNPPERPSKNPARPTG